MSKNYRGGERRCADFLHDLRAGAYVKKPYVMEKLRMAVREALHRVT
jgi:hypothetical protein